jgi:hypothetical protein
VSNVNNIKKAEATFAPKQLELGGKVRTLRFDLNAMAELENHFGSIQDAMKGLQEGKIASMKILLWAGFLHEEVTSFDAVTGEPLSYNITPYQVGGWIEMNNMASITESLGSALANQLGERKGSPLEELTPAQIEAAKLGKNGQIENQ